MPRNAVRLGKCRTSVCNIRSWLESAGRSVVRGPGCPPRHHTQRVPRSQAQATSSSAARPLVQGPPDDYDFRSDVAESTRTTIAAQHPDLLDLVDSGSLVVWRRPEGYVERRTDGYREPEFVFLVGTAHVSSQSARDVQRVIQAVKPDAVVVELCRGRSAILGQSEAEAAPGPRQPLAEQWQYQSGSSTEEEALPSNPASVSSAVSTPMAPASSQASPVMPSFLRRPSAASSLLPVTGTGGGAGGFIAALQRSAALGGQGALLLRLLLSNLGSTAASALGVQGGGEFVAARRAAEATGAQLVLGDRPIEITLQRAWDSLPWSQRLRLCGELLQAASSSASAPGSQALLTQQLVQGMQQDDAVSAFFRQLSQRYPELPGPLVHERDMYLAWSLRRSKAVCGARAVVGVVGRGHLRGVVYALGHDSGALRFSDLVGGMNSKQQRRQAALQGAARLVVETAVVTALYVVWTSWSSVSS